MRRTITSCLLSSAVVVVLLAGCATTTQVVTLNPNARVRASSEGGNTPVALRVVDQTDNEIIGYQVDDNGRKKGPIITTRDVSGTLYHELSHGLREKGFKPQQYTGSSRQKPHLTVTLARLSYAPGAGRKIHVDVKLEVKAVAAKRTYQADYSVDKSKSKGLLHGKKENQDLINAALGSALRGVLEDQKLLSIIAE